MYIEEQEKVLQNQNKNMLVSASAGSGKTYIMIKYISKLICEKKVPVKDLLVLTFTKVAAAEMKERLTKSLKEYGNEDFIVEQIDALSVSNISTIHSFCEKYLKKYANLLGLNENFEVADENVSQRIRQNAFAKALKSFYEECQTDYIELVSSFKNDYQKIKLIIFELENLANSVADKDNFLKEQAEKSESFFEEAQNYLFEEFMIEVKNCHDKVERLHVFDFEIALKKMLESFFQAKDIFEMARATVDFKFPLLPKRKEVGDETVSKLKDIKSKIVKIIDKIKSLRLNDFENIDYQKGGKLEKILLKLFSYYEIEEEETKKLENCLDFYDLEKYMKILSEKENLFSGIQYVFVDEYQDTNKVQERIVKNIAKNCNFVAVGDVKQGIYGFRLASSEIFLKDMEEFEKVQNSSVNYLQSNFRSSQKVLDFVNKIFAVCMTKEISGIDYQKSSMLKGVGEFKEDGVCAVIIDLIKEKENLPKTLPEIYSVKEAEVVVENKNLNQLKQIKNRIFEVLSSKIYDNGEFRDCKFSDIAILSRKRDALFNQLETYLLQSGIPVISNSRKILMDEPEIKMLHNYLKIALDMNDDVALLSVLMSDLSETNLDEVFEIKTKENKSLCEIVNDDKENIFSKFKANLTDFRKNSEIFGIKTAFLKLFNKTNYFAALNISKENQTLMFVQKFLDEIQSSGLEYDLPALIQYFDEVDCVVFSEPSVVEDSVLLTTIHNSKGLEYPIVFLIGCDQSLKKAQSKGFLEINESFGLALKYYDKENNNEITTVRMMAIKDFEAKKDFVEELFILYVALTRAKNRLYLFGETKDFEKYSIESCDSYFDLFFFSNSKIKEILLEKDFYKDEIMSVCVVDDVEEIEFEKTEKITNFEKDEKLIEKVENYLNFNYKINEKLNFRLKESVTSLNNKFLEDKNLKFSNEYFSFGENMVEIGNAYHYALKSLNFDKIENKTDLINQIETNKEIFDDFIELLDLDILLKNILLLKPILSGGKVYKEKEFLLKEKISNLIDEEKFDDEILVQGIVDLFIVKNNKIILIDFKYSNANNIQYLKEKYKNQLKLYKIALENAFNMPVENMFLLSLKDNNLIKVEF